VRLFAYKCVLCHVGSYLQKGNQNCLLNVNLNLGHARQLKAAEET
jgi:hypothetical protein